MEEKKYTSGKVEISTEEYRDLITECATAKAEADNYRSRFWSEQSTTKNQTEKINQLETKNEQYRTFISENPEILVAYKSYLASLVDEEI